MGRIKSLNVSPHNLALDDITLKMDFSIGHLQNIPHISTEHCFIHNNYSRDAGNIGKMSLLRYDP